jgi:hypothetical protein
MVVHDPNGGVELEAQRTETETYERLFEECRNLVLCCRSESYEHSVKRIFCWGTGVYVYFILFRL